MATLLRSIVRWREKVVDAQPSRGVPKKVLRKLRSLSSRERVDALSYQVEALADSWCRFGIRDPSLLTDDAGIPVLNRDRLPTLIFNGRDAPIKDGGRTALGEVVLDHLVPKKQVQTGAYFSDGTYTAAGSVIDVGDDRRMIYYSPGTSGGFSCVLLEDGGVEKKLKNILTPAQFDVTLMGLPYVIRADGRWHMLFEGVAQGRFRIFKAVSEDGFKWSPSNGGAPIYLPADDAWDALGQANPSLYQVFDWNGQVSFCILYNGCLTRSAWDLGLLTARSPEGPWIAEPTPFLQRSQLGKWAGGRLEGARLALIADSWHLFFFGLPTADSYKDGRIAAVLL